MRRSRASSTDAIAPGHSHNRGAGRRRCARISYDPGHVLKHRLLLGPVLIALVVGLFWLDGALEGAHAPGAIAWLFAGQDTIPPASVLFVVGLLVCSLGARELGRILRQGGTHVPTWFMALAAMVGLVVWAVTPAESGGVRAVSLAALAAAGVLVSSLILSARDRDPKGATAQAGAALMSFVYLGLLAGFLISLRREHSAWVVLSIIAITKSCDIGAYFTGRMIGRHKLIEWLSPGKTWEGLGGGVVTAALLAVLLVQVGGAAAPSVSLTLWQGAILGALLAIVGQGGDLVASLLKRDAGLKDSGTALPGFGGVLDVLDSVLLSAPVAYWALSTWGAAPGAGA